MRLGSKEVPAGIENLQYCLFLACLRISFEFEHQIVATFFQRKPRDSWAEVSLWDCEQGEMGIHVMEVCFGSQAPGSAGFCCIFLVTITTTKARTEFS